MFDEGFLHFVHLVGCAQPFHCGNLPAFGFHGQHRAGINRMTIHQNGASATRTAITNFFCAGEIETIPQCVE
jgi:hypothetical protein